MTGETAFAVLTLDQQVPAAVTGYLNDHQVPHLGWGTNPGSCGDRWRFGWDGALCGNAQTEPVESIGGSAVEAVLKATKRHDRSLRFAVQSQSSTSGADDDRQYDAVVEKLGGKVVYSESNLMAFGPNITVYIRPIVAARPNVVLLNLSFTEAPAMVAGIRADGYRGVILDFTSYVSGLLTAGPRTAQALEGTYVTVPVVPDEETTPYDRAIGSDLGAIGVAPTVSVGAFIGFAEAQELAGMLRAAGKDLDTKSFTMAVNDPEKPYTSFAGVPSGGPGKLVWPAGHYLPADCAAVVRVGATAYRVAEPFRCYTTFLVVPARR